MDQSASLRLALGCACLALIACDGELSGSPVAVVAGGAGPPRAAPGTPGAPAAPTAPGEACDGAAADFGAAPMRRLSRTEYRRTVRDLFRVDDLGAIHAGLSDVLSALPLDGGARFAKADRRISQAHIDAQFAIATTIGDAVADDRGKRAAWLGACAADEPARGACLNAVLDDFGRRALRRPLTDDERASYAARLDPELPAPEQWRLLVASLLMAPPFAYHIEEPPEDADLAPLSATERASRLSYLFWGSMPDDALFEAAMSGALDTEEGWRAEVERLYEHPRTQEITEAFWTELFHLDQIPQIPDQDPIFRAMVRDGAPDVIAAGPGFREAVRREIEQLTAHMTWTSNATFADLWTTSDSFADTPELAAIYGAEPWDGASGPIALDPARHPGLLSRAAFTISGLPETSPIHRGVHVLRDYLCGTIPSPDPNQLPDGALELPRSDGTRSTRDLVEAKTGVAPCSGCHVSFNGYGYALEAYDALGRYRETEVVYGRDGERLGEVLIDTQVSVQRRGEVELDGPGAVGELIGQDPEAALCFAERYFTFAHGREPGPEDACAVESLSERVRTEPLRDVFRSIALDPGFGLGRALKETP